MGGHSGITHFLFCINGVVFGKHRKKGNENRRRGKKISPPMNLKQREAKHPSSQRKPVWQNCERAKGPFQDEEREKEKDIYGLKYEAGLDDTGEKHHGAA
jgi:hypothetical protein